MDNSQQVDGKVVHNRRNRSIWMPIPIIVGAGPAGLAVAACLKQRGVPSLILERESCIASLWHLKTYDRLHLHLPKSFCHLPHLPFPDNFPNYPSRNHFLSYLESYRARFRLDPVFDTRVVSASYDYRGEFWRVKVEGTKGGDHEVTEYASPCLVVATGENAEEVVPVLEGAAGFRGRILHSSAYRSGEEFARKSVLVVGCGNSGMEVCLDLCDYNARPSLVVRDSVHVLPREMLGGSTFGLSMWLLKWLPLRFVDRLLLFMSHLLLGDTAKLGLPRPEIGPLELKMKTGKTPVLDVGTLAKINAGHIKVFPAIKRLTNQGAEFVDGRKEIFDAVILATGYQSNVPMWLKETNEHLGKTEDIGGKDGWKRERGLYAAGFSKRGLLGTSIEAMRIAQDIDQDSCKDRAPVK